LLYFIVQLTIRGVDFYLTVPELSLLDKHIRENFDNLIETEIEYRGREYKDIKIKIKETRIIRKYNSGGFNKIAGVIN